MKWKCKICGEVIEKDVEDEDWFDDYGEEILWGHIQMRHENEFEEVRDMETPDMLDECYDKLDI